MRNFKDIILDKLKVSKNSIEFTFTWDEFIEALYKLETHMFWLEELPGIKYNDLPEFEYEGKIAKVYALVMYDSYTKSDTVNILYSPDEVSYKNDIVISSLDALNDIIDQKLISEIYRIITR